MKSTEMPLIRKVLRLFRGLGCQWVLPGLLFQLYIPGLRAQPYFDVAGVTGAYTFPEGHPAGPAENYLNVSLGLPFSLAKNDKLVLSPFVDSRPSISASDSRHISLVSYSLPVTWLHSAADSSWSFTATFISRFNSSALRFTGNTFQAGGAFIFTYTLKPLLKIKAGVYYNREFFSDFIIPLAGLEWKLNPRLRLYGVIPNSLRMEYRNSNHLYSGLAFKSITNSYRYRNEKGYFKNQDNHLSLYTDIYLPSHITLSAEAGHTIYRKFTNRSLADFPSYEQDGFIVKLGIYYRIRLEE